MVAIDGLRFDRTGRFASRRRLHAAALLALALAGALGARWLRAPDARLWLKYAYDRVTVAPPEPLDARAVTLAYPAGLTGGPGGDVYVAERLGHRIWRYRDGQLTRIAGTGRLGLSPEGVRADRSRVFFPEGLAVDAEGGLVFADSWNQRVRRIDPQGRIWTIAGNGSAGFGGDGGPARDAQLGRPFDVAIDLAGGVLIVDWASHCVRRVDPAGIIGTFAGHCGEPGFSGDGGPAARAHLDEPYGISVGPGGEVYIADSGNDRVRRVGRDGRIETVAGTGVTGFAGDGGDARLAQLSSPQEVVALASGELVIDDEHNNRIRRVGLDGRIRTLLGRGPRGFDGDGGAAPLALIDDPEDVWGDGAGGLYVSDGANGVLRYVDRSNVARTVAGRPPAD